MEDEEVYYDAVLYISQEVPKCVLVYTNQKSEDHFIGSNHQCQHDNQYWECKNRTLVLLKDFDIEDDAEFVHFGLTKATVQVLVDNEWVRSIEFHSKANHYLKYVNLEDLYEVLTLDVTTEDQPSPNTVFETFLYEVEKCSDQSISRSGLAKKVEEIRKKFGRVKSAPVQALP